MASMAAATMTITATRVSKSSTSRPDRCAICAVMNTWAFSSSSHRRARRGGPPHHSRAPAREDDVAIAFEGVTHGFHHATEGNAHRLIEGTFRKERGEDRVVRVVEDD